MHPLDKTRTAAETLVDQLIINGVAHVFCVPGESYLAVLDAFHDRALTVTEALQPGHPPAWRGETAQAHADYLAWTDVPTPQPGAVNLGAVMVWLRENLPLDAILCNGAGNYAAWIHRFYRFRRFATHIAPTAAAMGYGMPSAVAMQRLYPERLVVCLNGDGDFLMNGQEFATAIM
jgi:acetolactate synthase-1/2/3 large subunit